MIGPLCPPASISRFDLDTQSITFEKRFFFQNKSHLVDNGILSLVKNQYMPIEQTYKMYTFFHKSHRKTTD